MCSEQYPPCSPGLRGAYPRTSESRPWRAYGDAPRGEHKVRAERGKGGGICNPPNGAMECGEK
eukprot:scaffold23175_cov29-Tisochrysis_lutea.AAC.1